MVDSRQAAGERAEWQALAHLQRHGLVLLQRHYRVAGGPSRRGGEVDLILREPDGTLVFVEVRSRAAARTGGPPGAPGRPAASATPCGGGAAASVDARKQRRLRLAAQHYLLRFSRLPPCRFDVVAIDGGQLQWLRGAFQADP